MPILPITTMTAAIMGLLLLILSLRVMRGRFSQKVSLGDGGDAVLLPQIRAHANLAEHVPLILILMAVVERGGGRGLWLEVVAALLIVGRILHPFGLSRAAPNPFRAGGMMLTWIVLLWLSIWALMIAARMFALT